VSAHEPFSIRQWLAGLPAGSIGWLFLVSGLLFFAGGAYHTVTGLAHDRSLAEAGRSVDGIVLEKTVGTTSTGRSRRTAYTVTFRFSALGEDIIDKVEVDKEVWDRLPEQGPVQVTYLPDEPNVHRVEGQDSEFSVWKLLMCLVGGGLMLYVGRLLLAGGLELSSESESED
jgi:hypothetical protein